jgi:dCTP deaminase
MFTIRRIRISANLNMALSDKKILEMKKAGDIIIEPFVRSNLSTSSYDVTLGEYYFPEHSPDLLESMYNIYDKEHVERIWGAKPKRAQFARELFKSHKRMPKNIRPSDQIIMIGPGQTILAHTNEFIGGLNHITTMMKARSSLGRSFIAVCKCAGWGDVGYTNRWTMEITNHSTHYHIPLVVGSRIAQIVFFETGEILKSDYADKGKYQTKTNIATLKKRWKATDMLPRLYLDQRRR